MVGDMTSQLLQSENIPHKPFRTESSSEQFGPDIEGMGAIARLVILFHAYHKPFTGGFVGIDGFLITNLLLKEHDRAGRISIWD
jgi:peptidoglycan/LPS O-acetylase OafA/YrhL